MALNTGKLAGKTAYITGASRGIGKAIALKFAKDGANIVIAAKTATANPKLPGTIYTAAEEIEAAGGKCLPCIVDVRDENAVKSSVEEAVKKFGGLDILVNNASAISLTGTLETPMKRYDLMNSINARGTYLCSQACLPYLKQSKNPHILTISPPLSMHSIWFKNHVAYSIAKFGMSMCVLGMAEEFKEEGVAVNALWPQTTIATAAVNMLGGGELMSTSRKPEIMADAAYVMVMKNSRAYTGNFGVDEDVLREVGISDFEQYSCVPGSELAPDFFLDNAIEHYTKMSIGGNAPSPTARSSAVGPQALFDNISTALNEDMVNSVKSTFMFDLDGEGGGQWFVDLENGAGSISKDLSDAKAACTLKMSCDTFGEMFRGELNSMKAFMSGQLQIKGDPMQAMKLEKLMKTVRQKSKL